MQHVAQLGHVHMRQCRRRAPIDWSLQRGGSIERRIMVHHYSPVTRRTNIELDTIRMQRHRVLEGRQRVLGRERGPTSMREDERAR